jgi:hypothetical protein
MYNNQASPTETHTDAQREAEPAPSDGPPIAPATPHDPDAAVGSKTRKDGQVESFYGYHEHTIVQVPDPRSDKDEEPRLITRFELTPASDDVVEVSLSLLDRLSRPAETLIADRHYSYKKPERWRDQLADRDIHQVLDLRADEHGFTDLDHMRWAAGWPHCPATPDTLATIERPAPTRNRDMDEPWQTFRTNIDRRFSFAFRRVTAPDEMGIARWECPAIAGKVGCPLRDGTIESAVQLGLEVVENAPDPNAPDFPLCCTQRTVTVDPGPLRKLMQQHYWGLGDWEEEWNKRTYVEGSYGNRKNTSTENLRRGHFRLTGIAMVHVATAMAAAAYNTRMARNWHERTGNGDPDHPLLQPDEGPGVGIRLTQEQYEQYCAEQLDQDFGTTG